MPDRIIHQSAMLYADLPTTGDVSVIVTNPLNQVIIDGELAEEWAEGRYRYQIPSVSMAGLWEVVWDNDNGVRQVTPFTVGPPGAAPVSRWDLKALIAARVHDYHIGRVEDAFGNTVVDPTVLGGAGNYRGWWLLIKEDGHTIPRRVTAFSGSAFTIQPPLTFPVARGTPYLLSPIPFDEIDTHLRTTMNGLGDIARIEVHVPNVPITTSGDVNEVYVPRGITHVHVLSIEDNDIPSHTWTMRSGRRLQFSSEVTGEFASLIGIRSAGFPQWEDSYLDFDSETIQARLAALLHAGRARGQAQDMEEHLRRHLTAMDEYMAFRRTGVGRPYPGAKAVID